MDGIGDRWSQFNFLRHFLAITKLGIIFKTCVKSDSLNKKNLHYGFKDLKHQEIDSSLEDDTLGT